MKATFLTALGLLWLGGVVYLLLWFRRGSGGVFAGFGIYLPLPQWVPHEVAFVLGIAVLVILMLGWAIPLGAGLHSIAKRD